MDEHASRRMDMHEWLAHDRIGVGLCAGLAMVGERVSRARIARITGASSRVVTRHGCMSSWTITVNSRRFRSWVSRWPCSCCCRRGRIGVWELVRRRSSALALGLAVAYKTGPLLVLPPLLLLIPRRDMRWRRIRVLIGLVGSKA